MTPEAPPAERERVIPGTVGLLRVFGVPIRLHFTFLLLLVFLIFVGIGERQSGMMSALYIFWLFASVLLHELGHALVAKQYGIRTLEIVMFPIGGLASMERQPKGKEEFWIAIAGPMVNFVIAAGILGWLFLTRSTIPMDILREPTDANLASRVAFGNLLLGGFNLLPAYPMDGGRILRAVLALRRPEEEATRIAARTGGFLAIAMGLFGLLSGNFMLVFIALFVYLGAAQEGAMARGRTLTSGFRVRDAMITDFRTLAHGDTIRQAGELLLATSQHDFPVVHGETVVGLLTRSALVRAMLAEGPDAYVAGAMTRDFVQLSPEEDLSQALVKLSGHQAAVVMASGKLAGLVTAENISEFVLLREVSLVQEKRRAVRP